MPALARCPRCRAPMEQQGGRWYCAQCHARELARQQAVAPDPTIRPIACCEPMRAHLAQSGCDEGIEGYQRTTETSAPLAWALNGCCGGCFVVGDLVYCPWCGSRLERA